MRKMEEYGIGNTPLAEIEPMRTSRILLKLESKNFLGSAKARTAYGVLRDLPDKAKGKVIVESTSGNFGLALGWLCKEQGLDFLAVVDSSMPKEKLERLQNAGIACKVVTGNPGEDLRLARIQEVQRLTQIGKYYWVNQYDNPSGVLIHEQTTGPEIWRDTGGKVTHCVCAMGSCGTIAGIGRFFQKNAPHVQICGVEPCGSTIFGTQKAPYINAGSGMKEPPGNLRRNMDVVDRFFCIPDQESIDCAKELYQKYGISAGITTGMACAAARRLAQTVQNAVIVVLSADGRENYGQYLANNE